MAVPFPEAQLEALIYMSLGSLLSLTVILGLYARKLKKRLEQSEDEQLRIDQMGLSHRAEEVLSTVLEEEMLQSELPKELKVSKATVSNAVSELFERDLIKKKKKANTYLIEPEIKEIEKQQR